MKKLLILCVLVYQAIFALAQNTFKIGSENFELNGKPFVIRCGEMHFARIPKKEWSHRLKMAKAMGLNAVCAYLFWNMHEPQKDEFTWKDQADAAAFCREAQKEGLYVILRPGPYACAEWEFGGFPWWLLKDKTMSVRTQHPYYLERARNYLLQVGKELAPLEIDRGGNIIMVQVENEYGSFGNDKVYMNKIKSYLQEAGFKIPLFHCDGPSQLKEDHPEGLFAVVNFGSNPEENLKPLRALQPTGPLMCGEFYPGWFDSWGRPHHVGNTERIVGDLKYMLDHNVSFSIYMAHGGTTFGTYTGANSPPYLPQTSSYDYDAPINEAGNVTEKFMQIRKLFAQYLQPGETLGEIPAAVKIQQLEPVKFTHTASVFTNLPKPTLSDTTLFMEDLNQDFGCVLYETTLPSGKAGYLRFGAIHDYATIYLDGKPVGTIDRRKNRNLVEIPARASAAKLRVLVEATGRVNYGGHMHDRKGIHGPVELLEEEKSITIKNWKNYSLRMGDHTLPVTYKKGTSLSGPGFVKGVFNARKTECTYLDMSKWNKGLVWINGKCLGRYWNIGPTQTMLVPASWLKKGQNEIVVFDLLGMKTPVLNFLNHPVLDKVTSADVKAHRTKDQQWNGTMKADYSGTFEDNNTWQTVNFSPKSARFVCLEALNSYDNSPYATISEIVLLDNQGKEIPRSAWKVIYADSEELTNDDGNASNVFDLQYTSIWHTAWGDTQPKYPHQIVIDLNKDYIVGGMKLFPRQDSRNGRIKDFRIFLSTTKFSGL